MLRFITLSSGLGRNLLQRTRSRDSRGIRAYLSPSSHARSRTYGVRVSVSVFHSQ